MSKPVLAMIGNKSVQRRFVLVEDSPVCLLGRDLLQASDAELHLSPEGMDLIMALSVITESFKSEQTILEILKAVLSEFWGKTTTGGGLLVSAQPVCIKTKADVPPSVRQYPIPLEAGKSIQNQIDQYLDKGILKYVCLHITL